MFCSCNDQQLTIKHLLIPINIVAFVMMLLLAFQTSQLLRDRAALRDNRMQQSKAFEDSQKLQSQLSALLVGTQKLAEAGNKDAKVIAGRLKDLGIIVSPSTAAPAAGSATVPPTQNISRKP